MWFTKQVRIEVDKSVFDYSHVMSNGGITQNKTSNLVSILVAIDRLEEEGCALVSQL
jgi:hypothetical protein